MQFLDLEFVADQFQQYADSDPVHWNSEEGCIKFGETPVFYKRFDDHFEIEIDGVTMEIPRI
ncbi:MAG: hypothetical protein C0456_19265 [Hyphomonas sp.]|uniref:hypothetical protein n=1 Tax=Hyphomonas sp. TaxID=87 RepID=UPI001D8006D1|nr:hypothetical protein [Hyphomonas sp.]MBA4228748.1 hypothetical protein [Hyphomonas sp.]